MLPTMTKREWANEVVDTIDRLIKQNIVFMP